MQLKIGDRIYIEQYNKIIRTVKIEKITNTMAKGGGYNFSKEIDINGYCKIKGQGLWDNRTAMLENNNLKARLVRQKKINWVDNNFKDFSDSQKIQIYNILNKQ